MTRQLSLVFGNRHGGRRKGAGRKPKGLQAGVKHRPRAEFARRMPVLVTQRLVGSCPSLRRAPVLALFKRLVVKLADERFAVVHWSLQSNHVHLICEADTSVVLARKLGGFFAQLAKELNKLWKRKGEVFSDRFASRVLGGPTEVRAALVYTVQNAHKHGAWHGRGPDHYSSGSEFDEWADFSAQSSRLPRAKTWLLNVGWRRFGLIALLEGTATRDEWLEDCWKADRKRVKELHRAQRRAQKRARR
jgi:REP element-mobilizing transposase RayT